MCNVSTANLARSLDVTLFFTTIAQFGNGLLRSHLTFYHRSPEKVALHHIYITRLKTHRLFQVDINRREQCCAANCEQVVNHVVPSCYS
jgi:hypothetical protein